MIIFLKMMARHVVSYEYVGRHELSKFTFTIGRNLQKELEMGEVIYDEIKNLFLRGKRDHYKLIKTIPSENLRRYLLITAMETGDTKVI